MSMPNLKGLWYQAGAGFNEQNCEYEVIERFAKLVAKECADSIDAGDGAMCSGAEHVWRNACRDEIKRVFEVEE